MKMQPIALESSTLVKTHTNEQSCSSFFEIAVRKKIFSLILVFFLQAPILYFLYTSEVSRYWVGTRRLSPKDRTSARFFQNNSTNCEGSFCAPGTNNTKSYLDDSELLHQTIASLQGGHNSSNKLTTVQTNETFSGKNIKPIEKHKNGNIKTEQEMEDNEFAEVKNKEIDDDDVQGFNPAEDQKNLLPDCSLKPPGLQGNLDISFANEPYSFEQIEEDNPLLSKGGHFKPPYCKALWKVAIIIPFRDRDEHLRYFLQYMHPTLQRQQLEYTIYIINQYGKGKFNRAKLMNVGYAESIKDHHFDCFVFHDVDLILENDFAVYNCPERPRHLSVGVDKFNYQLPYETIFGGVTEMTRKQFQKVNGYSNSFWGWGGEDDDMYNRIRLTYMSISRYSPDISKYRMISHGREPGNEANPHRFALIQQTGAHMRKDGINSLKYKVTAREDHATYTNITVNLFGPR